MLAISIFRGQCIIAANGSSSVVDLQATSFREQPDEDDTELSCGQREQHVLVQEDTKQESKKLALSPLLHLRPSRDYRERVPSQDESSTSSFSWTAGPVAELAEAFDKVLYVNHHQAKNKTDLSVSVLVQACRLFEANLKNAGLHQSAADLHQNLNKVSGLLQRIPNHPDSLRQVLSHEKNILQVHCYHHTTKTKNDKPQVHLNEKSGAVGFLWIRRSLQFNEYIYDLLSKQHLHGTSRSSGSGSSSSCSSSMTATMTPRDASLAAYHAVLKPYHSWLLRHIFTLGIRAISPLNLADFLGAVGGFLDDKNNVQKQQDTLHDFCRLVTIWKPLLQVWQDIFEELDLEDRRKV